MRGEHMEAAGAGNAKIAALGRLFATSRRIVALTGAGISTESGIPDFRSPGGLWSRVKPITFQEFVASEQARLEDWRRRFAMNADFARAEPNAGHRFVAWLGSEGKLRAVITQNIDGLHQRAGLPAELLIEIHGSATHGRCLSCGETMALAEVRRRIDATEAAPRCRCGGLVKAAVISFGERMPEEAMRRAAEHAGKADLFMVIGSSLQVEPAASLPLMARRAGARLVILNRDPTPLDDAAELVIRASIGEAIRAAYPQLVN